MSFILGHSEGTLKQFDSFRSFIVSPVGPEQLLVYSYLFHITEARPFGRLDPMLSELWGFPVCLGTGPIQSPEWMWGTTPSNQFSCFFSQPSSAYMHALISTLCRPLGFSFFVALSFPVYDLWTLTVVSPELSASFVQLGVH